MARGVRWEDPGPHQGPEHAPVWSQHEVPLDARAEAREAVSRLASTVPLCGREHRAGLGPGAAKESGKPSARLLLRGGVCTEVGKLGELGELGKLRELGELRELGGLWAGSAWSSVRGGGSG